MKRLDTLVGPLGKAWGFEDFDGRSRATVRFYFMQVPGQSLFWDKYGLGIVHLRAEDGLPEPKIAIPHATHELFLYAMDPDKNPTEEDKETWFALRPVNFVIQLQLPSDDEAKILCTLAAQAVLDAKLWAEPMLSGQQEPWRRIMLQTAAHLRGEEHGG